ncbi:MAG: sugar ABC transporter permease [Clostridiales bacterium]|jgi:multiple sugar transport system permease protein|nr:sugar ABC transporter permease [Clostridiales bacterium]
MVLTNKIRAKRRPIGRTNSGRDALYAFGLLLPYGLLFSLFIAVPIAISIYLSFTYFDVVQAPQAAGFGNYITLLTQDNVFFKNVLPNTVQFALIVGPGGYALSFILAWMLAQIQRGPRTLFTLALYMPSMAGGVFISVIWRTIFSGDQNGYINALLRQNDLITQPIQFLQSPEYLMPIMILVSLWSAMGIGFLAMLAGILNINEELYEAAYVDGIRNRFQEIIYITIPSLKPQMLFGAVMAIVGAFNNGAIGTQLSGGNPTPQNAGQLITNHIEDYGFLRYEMGYAAALSVTLLGIVWVFSKVAYRFFGETE